MEGNKNRNTCENVDVADVVRQAQRNAKVDDTEVRRIQKEEAEKMRAMRRRYLITNGIGAMVDGGLCVWAISAALNGGDVLCLVVLGLLHCGMAAIQGKSVLNRWYV